MNTGSWRRLKLLFQKALSLPPLKRDALLEQVRIEDEELSRQLRSMLAASNTEMRHLENLIPGEELYPGQQLGPYTIIRLLGRGGMGAVYLAHQERPHFRRVAVKISTNLFPNPEIDSRLERERAILAQLNHSCIAKLYESGTTPLGQPYFVMEFIEGQPITDYADDHGLGISKRLHLFVQVCHAVSHAHLQGVIHRDLKPQNILVVEENNRPLVKVIDFGIARDLGAETRHTHPGTAPGTLRYMSPEQAGLTDEKGRVLEPDFRSDVYTLGVVLYQLLTGLLPLNYTPNAAWVEIAGTLCRGAIDPPERQFAHLPEHQQSRLAASRAVNARTLKRCLEGDLSRVAMKALATQPQDRYASSAALAGDLDRFLRHLPIEAAPPGTLYLLERFCRRHLLAVGLSLTALVVLLGFTASTVHKNQLITRERDRATQESRNAKMEAATAERVTRFLVEMFQVTDPTIARGKPLTVDQILAKGTADIQHSLNGEPKVQARLLATLGEVYISLGKADEALPALQRALIIRQRLHGKRHIEVARSLHQLGSCHYERGDLEIAEDLFCQALDLYQSLDLEKDQQAGCLNDLGLVNKDLGRFEMADYYYREALNLRQQLYGPEHLMIAESLYNLAALLRFRRQLNEAEHLYLEALRQRRSLMEPNHPTLAFSLNGLALLYMDRANFAEAEPLMQEALALRREVLGTQHPMVATSINNLGGLFYSKGDPTNAEPFFLEALAMRRRLFGNDHYLTLQIVRNLARNFKAKGANDVAEGLYQELVTAYRQVRGPDHPALAGCMIELVDLLVDQERYREALPLAKEAEIIWQKAMPNAPSQVGKAIIYQAICLGESEGYQGAFELLHQGLVDFIGSYGATHPLALAACSRMP